MSESDRSSQMKPNSQGEPKCGPIGDDVIQGVVVVVRREDRYLMIRRAPGVLAGGSWCFVGGAIEPGETQAAAAAREFSEEVAGVVRPIRKVWQYWRPDGKLLLHWWLADLHEGELRCNPAEVSELRWCSADEVAALPEVLPSNLEFLAEVQCGKISLEIDPTRTSDK